MYLVESTGSGCSVLGVLSWYSSLWVSQCISLDGLLVL